DGSVSLVSDRRGGAAVPRSFVVNDAILYFHHLPAYNNFTNARYLYHGGHSGGSLMLYKLLQTKLHRVTVTDADLNYEGSCGIDEALLDASGMRPYQHIDLYNVSNGERFSTYVIKAPRGSGQITLNGAAARRAAVGDLLIICAYSFYTAADLETYQPVVVLIEEGNRPKRVAPEPLPETVAAR